MKTHHISLLTKDANQNVHFYTKVLGMRLIKNTVNQENIKIRHLFYGDYLGTPGQSSHSLSSHCWGGERMANTF
nr:VOC family protein [Lentilactobacillus rapi]